MQDTLDLTGKNYEYGFT